MLIIISPSKTLTTIPYTYNSPPTQPKFIKQSERIVERMRNLNESDLAKLMRINPSLAQLTYQRFISWHTPFSSQNSHPALLSFKGEVFSGIDAHDFTVQDMEFAQNHLRILSGLYGVLRPMDLIQPYRLEMGTPIDMDEHDNLYQLWTPMLNPYFAEELGKKEKPVLVNLASNEYSKAVGLKRLNTQIITPVFLDHKGNELKTITVYAKRARGLMTRFIIKNRLTEVEYLKGFTEEGYLFAENLSTADSWVFIR